jgi:hypothetical protein
MDHLRKLPPVEAMLCCEASLPHHHLNVCSLGLAIGTSGSGWSAAEVRPGMHKFDRGRLLRAAWACPQLPVSCILALCAELFACMDH